MTGCFKRAPLLLARRHAPQQHPAPGRARALCCSLARAVLGPQLPYLPLQRHATARTRRGDADAEQRPPARPRPHRVPPSVASPRLFIPSATPCRFHHSCFACYSTPTPTNRPALTFASNGACCQPLCRAALPPCDALPRAVTRGGPGPRATEVLQGHAGGSGRHAYRHSCPASRYDIPRRRAAHHHPGDPRAQVLPIHPCTRGRANHHPRHAGAGQGPGRGSSQQAQAQGQGPRAQQVQAQAQGRGPRARTACQSHRACPGCSPSHHRNGTGGRSPRSRSRGASRRAGPGDQAHRGPRPRARQEEEEAVVQGQEEEEEGPRPGSGRRGTRRQDLRGTHLRRRGPGAQRRLRRRRHRECRRKDHRDDGGRDPDGAWRSGDARLDSERPWDPISH